MKTYFLIIFASVVSLMANAAIQITSNQDKPTVIYVKKYFESVSASQNSYQYYGGNSSQTFNETVNFQDGTSASGNSHWTFHALGGAGDYLQQFNMSSPHYYRPSDGYTWVSVNATNQFSVTDVLTGFYNWWWNPYGPNYSITNAGTSTNFMAPVTIENCNISATSSTVPDWYGDMSTSSYQRTAHVAVKIKTGGKSTSKLRNLIFVALEVYPDVVNGIENSWQGTIIDGQVGGPFDSFVAPRPWQPVNVYEYSNVPPSSISLGSYGNTVSNSIMGVAEKYLILPDNADVDITPSVSGLDNYSVYFTAPQKYHSYFDVFVQQANPGYSLMFYSQTNDVGHAFWQFRTDAPSDALKYISTNLTAFLGHPWGFYPVNGLFTLPGILQNDGPPTQHSYNIQRTFYVGFSDLLQGLIYTRGIFNAPPVYSLSSFNCVGAVRGAGFAADVFGLPWDESPQNFGVTLMEMYSAPGQTVGPFIDTADVFYSSAPY
jgi:hypothetical protein